MQRQPENRSLAMYEKNNQVLRNQVVHVRIVTTEKDGGFWRIFRIRHLHVFVIPSRKSKIARS